MDLQPIKELISKQLNEPIGSLGLIPVGGGSINSTWRLTINGQQNYFLKVNSATKFPGLFELEKKGLEFLAKQNCLLTPTVISSDTIDNYQLLLLEWIQSGIRNENFWKKFGEQLATLHRVTNERFGFDEDNYMGSLPQANNFTVNWSDFFIQCRLQPQIKLAIDRTLLQKTHVASFESLFKNLDSIFPVEMPALVHGDLWSGNFRCNDQSLPVLIDPAIYFGHRSMDLGMTTLFGGFDKAFYEAYHYHFPLPSNYGDQWEVCNLYPLLIHLNLFGSSYLYEIEGTLKRFA